LDISVPVGVGLCYMSYMMILIRNTYTTRSF